MPFVQADHLLTLRERAFLTAQLTQNLSKELKSISVTQILAVVVRYFTSEKHDVVGALLELITLYLKMEQLKVFIKQLITF